MPIIGALVPLCGETAPEGGEPGVKWVPKDSCSKPGSLAANCHVEGSGVFDASSAEENSYADWPP